MILQTQMKNNTLFDTNEPTLHDREYGDVHVMGNSHSHHTPGHDPALETNDDQSHALVSYENQKTGLEENAVDEHTKRYVDEMSILGSSATNHTNEKQTTMLLNKNNSTSDGNGASETSMAQPNTVDSSLIPPNIDDHIMNGSSSNSNGFNAENAPISETTPKASNTKPQPRLTSRGWFKEDPSREIDFVMLLIDQLTWTNYLNFTYALKVLRDNYQYPFTDTKTLKHRYDELVKKYLQKKEASNTSTPMNELDNKIKILLDKKQECDNKKKRKVAKNNRDMGHIAAYVLNNSSNSTQNHPSINDPHFQSMMTTPFSGMKRGLAHVEELQPADALSSEKLLKKTKVGANESVASSSDGNYFHEHTDHSHDHSTPALLSSLQTHNQGHPTKILPANGNTSVMQRLQRMENKVDGLTDEIQSLKELLEKMAAQLFS